MDILPFSGLYVDKLFFISKSTPKWSTLTFDEDKILSNLLSSNDSPLIF